MYIDKKCATCTDILNGRKDKIFCSKTCQNKHHKIARTETAVIQRKRINAFVKRNYIVLRGLMGVSSKSVRIHRDVLFKYGFNGSHFLLRKKKNKKSYCVIKEFQFRYVGKGYFEIIRFSKGPNYSVEFLNRWNREFGGNQRLIKEFEEAYVESSGRSIYIILNLNETLYLATNLLFSKRYSVFQLSKPPK